MAEAKAKGKAAEAPKKSKKKLFIIVGAVVALAGGGFAYKTMAAAPAKAAPVVAGDIVPVDPITVNLADSHYLKVAVSIVLIQGKGSMADFKPSQADNIIIDEFSNRTVDAVSGASARTALLTELTDKLKKAYEDEIFAVYLTQFVTQ